MKTKRIIETWEFVTDVFLYTFATVLLFKCINIAIEIYMKGVL